MRGRRPRQRSQRKMEKRTFQSLTRLLAALAICALPVPAQTVKDLPALSAVTRELKGGETHSYRLTMSSGQFLHAVVEQLNMDVVTAVFAPDGKQLTESDSPNDDVGSEPIIFVAPAAGEYRIDIRSPNKDAAAGRYQIKIVALREASAIDKGHAAAQTLIDEATKLLAKGGAPATRVAIEKSQQAVPLFEAAGDTYPRALALFSIGISYYSLNDYRKALEYFDQASPLAAAVKDRRLEAGINNYAGGMLDLLGNVDKAVEHFQRANKLAHDVGWLQAEGDALVNIGKIYGDQADWQQALSFYEKGLLVFQSKPGSKQAQAIIFNNIGMAYSRSGEQQKALDYLQQALTLHRNGKNKSAETQTLINIARSYRLLRDYPNARTYQSQAQAVLKETANRALEGDLLDEIGLTYFEEGQPDKAVAYLLQAAQIQQSIGNQRRGAVTLTNLGQVYNRLQQSEKAVEQFTNALAIFRDIGDLSNSARALEGLARAEARGGKLDDARKHIDESLALIETVRARASNQLMRSAYRASVENAYELYIDVLMQQHAKDPSRGLDAEALQISERGRARNLLAQLGESRVNIRQGVDARLLEKERDLNQVLNAKAQREMQRKVNKAGAEELATLRREISALEDEYQQVQAAIRKSSPQYSALTQPQPLGLKEIQQQLDRGTVFLEYALGEERSYLWVVSSDSLKTFQLAKREQIENVAREVSESLVARSVVKSLETPSEKRARIAEADAKFQQKATELGRMILSPAAAEFGKKRLVVVSDGALQYVPFAALSVVPNRPLILDNEIISLPSASAFAVQRQNLSNRELAPKAVAVIADPVFSPNDPRLKTGAHVTGSSEQDSTRRIEHLTGTAIGQLSIPRLPFTRWEADQILAVAPHDASMKALDFRASRSIATSDELSKYRYVHFATHGYLDTARSGLSAIVLSMVDEQGNPQDGFLRTHDIYNLKLPAELVVLSACETGLGKEMKGEGIEGLTRGFMYAGARRVVVSLWNVNDKATASLMQRLYVGMLRSNKTPAAALRAAQIEMLRTRQWQSPYYWAAFVMQGEWN
jgi:CHAT domain-containing protein/tetratricopeptide (TPR) repeat protein